MDTYLIKNEINKFDDKIVWMILLYKIGLSGEKLHAK